MSKKRTHKTDPDLTETELEILNRIIEDHEQFESDAVATYGFTPHNYENYIFSYITEEFIPLVKNRYGEAYSYAGDPNDSRSQIQYLFSFIKTLMSLNPPDFFDTTSPLYTTEGILDSNGHPLVLSYLIIPAGVRFYKRAKNRVPKVDSTTNRLRSAEIWLDYSGRPGSGLPSFTKHLFEYYDWHTFMKTVAYFGKYVWTLETAEPLLLLNIAHPFTSINEVYFRRFCDGGNGFYFCDQTDGYILDLMRFNPNKIWLFMGGRQEGVKEIKVTHEHKLRFISTEELNYPEPYPPPPPTPLPPPSESESESEDEDANENASHTDTLILGKKDKRKKSKKNNDSLSEISDLSEEEDQPEMQHSKKKKAGYKRTRRNRTRTRKTHRRKKLTKRKTKTKTRTKKRYL
jgi:hypothetical protein